MALLPPGTLLQLMYLGERLATIAPGRFIEIGPGAGEISALLLSLGWRGTVYDLEPTTIAALTRRFGAEIEAGRYQAINADWIGAASQEPADLVISCMVIEHLDDVAERDFIRQARRSLTPAGRMVAIVPASPRHWGIEDEIAGHHRRYSAERMARLLGEEGWRVADLAGLTFPVSNVLLPVSNFLVRRAEARKLSLSMLERTRQSGIRQVPMKTSFPPILGLLLNRRTLYPLHVLQKLFRRSRAALVLYVEASPA